MGYKVITEREYCVPLTKSEEDLLVWVGANTKKGKWKSGDGPFHGICSSHGYELNIFLSKLLVSRGLATVTLEGSHPIRWYVLCPGVSWKRGDYLTWDDDIEFRLGCEGYHVMRRC